MITVFDEVRTACASVCAQANYVKIKKEAIANYALSLPKNMLGEVGLDPTLHFSGNSDATLAYIVTLDTINFGSGYFPHLNKEDDRSGYYTISTRLKRYFENEWPISSEQFRSITSQVCAKIFGQEGGDKDCLELMNLFAQALNQLGKFVISDFGGSFSLMIEKANHSAERLVSTLAKMPYFVDVRQYKGIDVPFFKRAQIMASDLNLALGGKGLGYFSDLASLTCFADNLVPHVLRMDGLLEYDNSLLERIQQGDLIRAASDEEIEIRASAVCCVELISNTINEYGARIEPRQIDSFLWNRGQGKLYKSSPRHRTKTTSY